MPLPTAPRRLLSTLALALALGLAPMPQLAWTAPAAAQATPSAAEPATVDELVDAVSAAYKNVQSIKADFTQVTRSAAMGEGEKQRGRIQLMRPRMMRWDFTAPDVKLFVTDGATMWVYTPAEKQVIVSSDMGGGDSSGVDQLLTTLEKLDELFVVTLLDRQGGAEKRSYVLQLTPRKEGGFKSLRLQLNRRYELEKLVIVDAFDNETEMAFTNLKLNPTLATSEFSFTAPAGVSVVRADGL